MQMSTDCETKEEYDRSHADLKVFLSLKETRDALSDACINAMIKLQDNLRSKEYKLAGYLRLHIPNTMDAVTTSPVESNNNSVKHGPSQINATMNLDTATKKLLNGINTRFERRRQKADREVSRTNLASRAITNPYVIRKGQGLIDRNYDNRLHCKSARLAENHWISWNWWTNDNDKIVSPVELYLPKFMRVRQLNVVNDDDDFFVKCICGVRDRVGVPCECFFSIADNGSIGSEEIIDIGMIEARYLKLYNAHYGERNDMGKTVYQAQEQCVRQQGKGVKVSTVFADKLLHEIPNKTYPILGKNTTDDDLREAMYVMSRSTTTRLDMARYRLDEDGDDDFNNQVTLSALDDPTKYEKIVLSQVATNMKMDIEESVVDCDHDNMLLQTSEEKFDMRKDWSQILDEILTDERGSKEMK